MNEPWEGKCSALKKKGKCRLCTKPEDLLGRASLSWNTNTWTNERSWWRGGYNQPLWLRNSKRGMRLARRYGRWKDSGVWRRAFSASRYKIQGGYTCTWRRGLILVQGKAFPLMRPLSKVKWIPQGLSGGGTTKKEGENQYMGTMYYCTLKGQTTPLRPGAVRLNLSKEKVL